MSLVDYVQGTLSTTIMVAVRRCKWKRQCKLISRQQGVHWLVARHIRYHKDNWLSFGFALLFTASLSVHNTSTLSYLFYSIPAIPIPATLYSILGVHMLSTCIATTCHSTFNSQESRHVRMATTISLGSRFDSILPLRQIVINFGFPTII